MHGINNGLNIIDKINFGVENYQGRILKNSSEIVEMIDLNRDTVFAITGSPGSGKGGTTKKIGEKLGLKLKSKPTDNPNRLELGMLHKETGKHFLYVILDCFFKEIGVKRYKEMLQNKENFLEMFSDDGRATDFILKYLNSHESFEYDGVYLKTDIERELSKALSSLFVNGREKGTITTTFLDGVNSFKIADMVSNEVGKNKIKVVKILIKPNPGLSFQRIIKRDVIGNGKKKTKPLDVVTRFRLEEAIYLRENFTLPAIQDKNAYMYDFTHKTDLILPPGYNKNVSKSIIKSAGDLLSEKRGDHFDEYLIAHLKLLINHFSDNYQNTN